MLGERRDRDTCPRHVPTAAASCAPGAASEVPSVLPAPSFVEIHLGRLVGRVRTENRGCINLAWWADGSG